jgi:hypothetical protein
MIASSENRHSLSSLVPESYGIVGHYHPSCRIKHKRRMSIGHCFSGIELQFVVSAEKILPVVAELLPAKHVFPLLPAVFLFIQHHISASAKDRSAILGFQFPTLFRTYHTKVHRRWLQRDLTNCVQSTRFRSEPSSWLDGLLKVLRRVISLSTLKMPQVRLFPCCKQDMHSPAGVHSYISAMS